MPKQEFEVIDYFGPLVVATIFSVVLFTLSFFIINWFCITKHDDFTVFEKAGARKFNVKLGPHSMRQMRKAGLADEESIISSDDEE